MKSKRNCAYCEFGAYKRTNPCKMKSYILASTYKDDNIYKSVIEWNKDEMGEGPVFESYNMTESLDS